MERFAVFVSVCVYVCLCMGGRLQLVMRGYGEQCSALRLAIEFLVRAHWETAVLGQILAGRPREATGGHGSKFLPLAAPWPQIEFLFWDHWERAVLG